MKRSDALAFVIICCATVVSLSTWPSLLAAPPPVVPAQPTRCQPPKMCVDPRTTKPATPVTGCREIEKSLKKVLAEVPCRDCPPPAILKTLLEGYAWHEGKGTKQQQRRKAMLAVATWVKKSYHGYCPGVPSTGRLAMTLHEELESEDGPMESHDAR